MNKSTKAQWNDLYRDPLPLPNIVPLPVLTLNPISVLLYVYQYLFPQLKPHHRPRGVLNRETKSVWVSDPESARILWTSGFFGKGQFSRSEPTWYTRTQRGLGLIGRDEKLTPEEVTQRRRLARTEKKAERAKKEKEALINTLRDEGQLVVDPVSISEAVPNSEGLDDVQYPLNNALPSLSHIDSQRERSQEDVEDDGYVPEDIPNIEHLQLTLHEALFLSDALDVMDIYDPVSDQFLDKCSLLPLLTSILILGPHSPSSCPLDSTFLVQYAVYHHYRSLGWTIRSGIKFGVDWVLYKRGPVFRHADFSLVVIPAPIDEPDNELIQGEPWWRVHTLARVNGQVKKTVILVYVQYQAGEQVDLAEMSLAQVLGRYKIREVSLRRWIPSRNRD